MHFVAEARAAVEFDCVYTTGNVIALGDVYYCEPQVTLTGEFRELERVDGRHWPGFTNDEVEFLGVFDQNLPFIPRNIATFFKNIKALDFWNSNLETISAEDLEQFPNLLVFSAHRSYLVSIDGDLFKHTPKLVYINFDENQILHVGRDLVKHLNDLQALSFVNNPCVDTVSQNHETVLWLNDQLPILCPQLGTSSNAENPSGCSAACLERIESSEEQNVKQNEVINDLIAAIIEQNGEIKELTERLLEVERRVRDLASAP